MADRVGTAPWNDAAYQRLTDASLRDGELVVHFANGDVIEVDTGALEGAAPGRLDWTGLEVDEFELRVPAEEEPLEISWLDLRALTDRVFAAHLAEEADVEARRVGERIRALRERRGLSSRELAERAGISAQSLSRIERGRHDVVFTTLQRLLAAMGFSLADLAAVKHGNVSFDHALARLREAGLARPLAEKVLAGTEDSPRRATQRLQRMFGWTPADLAAPGRLPIFRTPALAGRFKDRAKPAEATYVMYAHYIALLVDQATERPRQEVPRDPAEVREEVLRERGRLRFEALLEWCWERGVAVVPLLDPGQFHGACWTIGGRPVIVLKQRTPSEARWVFDLSHEVCHVARHLSAERPGIIETSEIAPLSTERDAEEEEASEFAGSVLLKDPEALAQRAVEVAQGSVERLKTAVTVVAREADVEVDALANYLAYRLAVQRIDWWGPAQNLQGPRSRAPELAREALLRRLDWGRLAPDDRQLLAAAIELGDTNASA
jgi:transcriptional regulator with XRE-family HTH domain/Zn-dependent peptidase ImmA (M78 family)